MDVIRHLHQLEHFQFVASGHGAEDGVKHQMVMKGVEQDSPVSGPLIAMIEDALDKQSIIHGTVKLPLHAGENGR